MPPELRCLAGRELRYVLIMHLHDARRPLSLDELGAGLEHAGYRVSGRASKTISDALRWEVRRGRVVRCGRGRYASGTIPRSTWYWIRNRVRSLHDHRPIDSNDQTRSGVEAKAHPGW